MGGQFHDILPGTSTPKAVEFSWNDDVIALNQFASVLTSATEGIVGAMNTQTAGVPVVVYNPLNIEREGVVEATVALPGGAVRVGGPNGREVAAQVVGEKLLFLARAGSVGYAVYSVERGSGRETTTETSLKVTDLSLANHRYRVEL